MDEKDNAAELAHRLDLPLYMRRNETGLHGVAIVFPVFLHSVVYLEF